MTDQPPSGLPAPAEVAARLRGVRARIAAAGGDPATVAVLAVTKGHPAEVIDLALGAGLADVGENYAQELVRKAALRQGQDAGAAGRPAVPRWHFIGQLQRNKVRQLAPYVAVWQSIDRVELVTELARRAPGATVLVQVDVIGEAGKAGCAPGEVAALAEAATAAGLRVDGLMTVGPTDATVDPRPGFDTVRRMADRLGLAQCSMGMTADLEDAVRCGSTMVRIGTALFGPRPPRAAVEH